MAWTYANIQDRIELNLQDAAGAIFDQGTSGEIQEGIKDCLREISEYAKHIVRVVYAIESRTGSSTSTSIGHLVDTSNLQFVAGDVDKVIHNTTDNTYAVITAYTSTSDVTLSKDIMASGESYAIYSKGCHQNNQINIGDVTDCLWVDHIEYPINTQRKIDSIDGDILTIGVETTSVGDSGEVGADVDVHVFFNKRHKVSQMTNATWAVNLTAGYDAGDTSMAIDAVSATGTIEEGQEFTIQYRKEIYTITADATIADNAATISFYPGLEADVDNNDVITFKLSTLPSIVEPAFCKYAAGSIMMGKASLPIQEAINSISVLTTASTAIGNMSKRITDALLDFTEGRIAINDVAELITSAEDAIGNVNRNIDLALVDLDVGRTEIKEMSPYGDVSNRYREYATSGVSIARGFLDEAQGHFRQAQADESEASTHGVLGAKALSVATQDLNQAVGYLRKMSTQLSVAGTWRLFEEKGRLMKNEAIIELQRQAEPQKSRMLSRT